MSHLTERVRLLARPVRRVFAGPHGWPIVLFVGFLLVRLPFRARFLVSWDSANFALGVAEFDVLHHQPHPPGYIGYVLLGRLLSWGTGDANAALTLISVLAGAIAPAVLYVLARRFVPHRHALAAALLFGTAPLVWYYSSVALTYIVAAAIAVPIAWAAHVARTEGSERHLLASAVLLALLGGLRQTDLLLMLPLVAYAALAFGRRARLRAAGVVAVLTLPWLVPLVWTSGGPVEYVRMSADLAGLAGGGTWLGSMNFNGLRRNVTRVASGALLGTGLGLAVVPLALRYGIRPLAGLGREDRRLLAAWSAPALATYFLIHTGQMGYVLLVLPIGFLLLARMTVRIAEARSVSLPQPLLRPAARVGAASVGALVAANAFAFFLLPSASTALVSRAERVALGGSQVAPPPKPVPEKWRQYDLSTNDRHWQELIDAVEGFDPDRTALLAVPHSNGSFRHLAYYLPEYRIFTSSRDASGDFGFLFEAGGRRTSYAVEGFRSSDPTVRLPDGVDRVLVPDPKLALRLDRGLRMRERRLDGGATLVVVTVPPGSTLSIDPEDGRIGILSNDSRVRAAGVR